MSIMYHRNGDYLLPNMGLNETDKTPLNQYGRMRLRYLQEHRPGLYTRLILSGKLYEDLLETQKKAQYRVEIINYAHLFPSKQQEMAKHLSQAMHEKTELSDNTCAASTEAKEGSAA